MVLELERRRLRELQRPDLAEKVEWVSKTKGDGLGYDVLSFEEDDSERYIEVKTTGMSELAQFYVTAGELSCSEEMGESYYLYRVYNYGAEPKVYVLQGWLSASCRLVPSAFKALPK